LRSATERLFQPESLAGCEGDEHLPMQYRRRRHIVHVHLSHGGGGFVEQIARFNHERMFKYMGSCMGDLPREDTIVRSCHQRLEEARGYSFSQMERGFETGELCFDTFDYILFLRNPLDRMNSHISKYSNGSTVISLLEEMTSLKTLNTTLETEWSHMNFPPGYPKSSAMGEGMSNFDNLLTRWLTGDSRWLHAPIGSINRTAYVIARQNLERFMFTIALDAKPLLFKEAIRRALGWELPETMNIHHHGDQNLTRDELEVLKSWNVWDMKIWEMVSD